MQYDARGMGLVRRGDDRHEVFLFEFVCGPLEEGKDMKSIVVPFDNSRWYGLESVRKMVNRGLGERETRHDHNLFFLRFGKR